MNAMNDVTTTQAAAAAGSTEPSATVQRPNLLTLDDALAMRNEDVATLFKQHLNPMQYNLMKLLGFHKITISCAEGMYYYDQNGRAILDFFGGFGSLALGHNHPRILAARRRFQEEKRHEIAIGFMSQYAAALAKNLAAIAPEDLDMIFFASSGSEAVEYALKLAEKTRGERKRVVYAEKAFHGKTRGSLSVTDSTLYRDTFSLLDTPVRVPFGDAAALRAVIAGDRSIGTLILETVQGGAGIIAAPPAYWREVRAICNEFDVVWIADEVQCGVGRTGRFFAFEHTGVVPDIVALAKSLGGGKTAIGAVISRRPLFMAAYGSKKTAIVHAQATFGGIGEACATAIETLNVLYDEGLIDNSARMGAMLLAELKRLAAKYPDMIKDVRGQGLMIGLEFHDISRTMPIGLSSIVSMADDMLKGSLCGFVGTLMLRDHSTLVAFTEYNRNVMRLQPPLIVTEVEIQRFVEALDAVLARGVVGIVSGYAKGLVGAG
jgi:acetylornithine/succinyldiaminopimelate/putrescine aminotransferase